MAEMTPEMIAMMFPNCSVAVVCDKCGHRFTSKPIAELAKLGAGALEAIGKQASVAVMFHNCGK